MHNNSYEMNYSEKTYQIVVWNHETMLQKTKSSVFHCLVVDRVPIKFTFMRY